MLQFLRSLLSNVSRDPDAKAAAGLILPWLAVAAASIVMPWTLYLAIPRGTLPDPFAPEMVWKALWPVLLGAALAIGLWRWARWLESVPQGGILAAESRAARGAAAGGKAVERLDGALRSWPVAGVSLLVLVIALGAAVLVR